MASSVHPMLDNAPLPHDVQPHGQSHLLAGENHPLQYAPDQKTRSISIAALSAANQNDTFKNLYSGTDNFLYDVFMWLIDNISGDWSTGPVENGPIEDGPANPADHDNEFVTCRVKFKDQKDLNAFVAWLTHANPTASQNP
jgi:hypothetical protein